MSLPQNFRKEGNKRQTRARMTMFLLFYIYIFITGNISISMYIMCAILCLFSALNLKVGALQMSIIIIIIIMMWGLMSSHIGLTY